MKLIKWSENVWNTPFLITQCNTFDQLCFQINIFLKTQFISKDGVTFNPFSGGTTDFEPLKRSTHLVLRATPPWRVQHSKSSWWRGGAQDRHIWVPPSKWTLQTTHTSCYGTAYIIPSLRPKAHLRIAQYGRKIWPHPIDDCKQMFLSGHLHPSF